LSARLPRANAARSVALPLPNGVSDWLPGALDPQAINMDGDLGDWTLSPLMSQTAFIP
jgi:hypothetical protein